tara:strand:+ start:11416 stop:12390 length:975 start_codon:yes stop_codon:yes gene_type:complete
MHTKLRMQYVSPFDREYSSHYDHVAQFNRGIMGQISTDLNRVFRDFEGDVAVSTTGSDGRLEKGPFSPMEMRVYGERVYLDESLRFLRRYVSEEGKIHIFDDFIEPKDLSGSKMNYLEMSIGGRDVLIASPNRFFDSETLFETDGVYKKAYGNIVEELNGSNGSSIFKKVKEKARECKRVTTSGIQSYSGGALNHYDLEQGMAFYDPEKKIWSFKQGPLRLVQFSLVKDSIKKLRESNRDNEFIFGLPRNTIDKISRIEVEGRTPLSIGGIDDLSDSYKFFLHQYHRSQFNFAENGSKTLEFDPKEVRERCESLRAICSDPIIN